MEKEVNAHTLFLYYRDEFEEYIKTARPPIRSVKDLSLLKKLINEQGAEEAQGMISYALKNWDMLRTKLKITGLPTIGILWGFRFSLLGQKNSARKNSVEYKKVSSKKSPNSDEAIESKDTIKNLFLGR